MASPHSSPENFLTLILMCLVVCGQDGDFEDPAKAVDLRLVKTKSFDMPPMTVRRHVPVISRR